MVSPADQPTAYEILGVHARAPGELISVAYWMTIDEIREQRALGRRVDDELHLVTRAYELVAAPEVRAGYDLSLGHTRESLTTRRLQRKGWGPFRAWESPIYYEVAGLHETAPAKLVAEACRVMRNVYLRAPIHDERRVLLLSWLNEACETLSDPGKRGQYAVRLQDAAERESATARPRLPAPVRWLVNVAAQIVPWMNRQSPPVLRPTMLERLAVMLNSPGGAANNDPAAT